jgi:hypothetical protein
VPFLDIHQDHEMPPDETRFPEHDYPSDYELWLEPDGIVRIRSGIHITEFTANEARDLGLALIELADAAEQD